MVTGAAVAGRAEIGANATSTRIDVVAAREMASAAIHEASHAVVARHFGCHLANPRIWPNENLDPTERSWLGHCRFIGKFEGELSSHEKRLIGLAGVVGEAVHEGETEVWEIDEYIRYLSEPSDTDLELIGDLDYLDADIATVMALLNLYWNDAIRMAEECIEFWRGFDRATSDKQEA